MSTPHQSYRPSELPLRRNPGKRRTDTISPSLKVFWKEQVAPRLSRSNHHHTIIPATDNHPAWILGAQPSTTTLRKLSDNKKRRAHIVSMLHKDERIITASERATSHNTISESINLQNTLISVDRNPWFDHGTLNVITGYNQTVADMIKFQNKLYNSFNMSATPQEIFYCHCMAGKSRSLVATIAFLYFYPDKKQLFDFDDWSDDIKNKIDPALRTRLQNNPTISDIVEFIKIQRPTVKSLLEMDGDQAGFLGLMALEQQAREQNDKEAKQLLFRKAQNIGLMLKAPLDYSFRDPEDRQKQEINLAEVCNGAYQQNQVNLLMAMVVPLNIEKYDFDNYTIEDFNKYFQELQPSEQARFAILWHQLEKQNISLNLYLAPLENPLEYARQATANAKHLTAGDQVELLKTFGDNVNLNYTDTVKKLLKGTNIDKYKAGVQLAELLHNKPDSSSTIIPALKSNKFSYQEQFNFINRLQQLKNNDVREYAALVYKNYNKRWFKFFNHPLSSRQLQTIQEAANLTGKPREDKSIIERASPSSLRTVALTKEQSASQLRASKTKYRPGTILLGNYFYLKDKSNGIEPGFFAIRIDEDFCNYVRSQKNLNKDIDIKTWLQANREAAQEIAESLNKSQQFTRYLIKQDYTGPDKKGRVTIPITQAYNSATIEDEVPTPIKWLAVRVYAWFRKRPSAVQNRNALLECIGNRIAREAHGMQCQEQTIIYSTYPSGKLKILPRSTWDPEIQPLGELQGGNINSGNYLAIAVDATTKPSHLADNSITDLGEYLALMLTQGDIDGIGRKAQNKFKKNGKLFGLDFGKTYRQQNTALATLNDDFSFKNPRNKKQELKNFSLFTDASLKEKMKGVHYIRRLVTGELPSKEILEAYGEEFKNKINKIPYHYDMEIFDNYIQELSDISQKATQHNNTILATECKYLISELRKAKINTLNTNNQLLKIFEQRLGLTPTQLDILEACEKLTSQTSLTSPDGTVLLNYMRVTKRVPWKMKVTDNQCQLVCLAPTLAIKQQLEQYITDKGVPNITIEENQDGNLTLTFDQNDIAQVARAFNEATVQQHKHPQAVLARTRLQLIKKLNESTSQPNSPKWHLDKNTGNIIISLRLATPDQKQALSIAITQLANDWGIKFKHNSNSNSYVLDTYQYNIDELLNPKNHSMQTSSQVHIMQKLSSASTTLPRAANPLVHEHPTKDNVVSPENLAPILTSGAPLPETDQSLAADDASSQDSAPPLTQSF